jgi:hypothetical protein
MPLAKTYTGASANGWSNAWFSQFGGWGQQAQLRQNDPGSGFGINGDQLGTAIAVSSDGNTVAIGAPNKSVNLATPYRGAVYIFVRSGTTWTQQARLVASDGSSYNEFGSSLSISSDGNYLVVGRPNDNSLYPSGLRTEGSVYVFIRSGTTWAQQAKITPSIGSTYVAFGMGVSMNSAGSTIISYANHLVGGVRQHNVYVFTRSGSTWSQATTISTSGQGFPDNFAMSADGTKIIVGNSAGTYADSAGAIVYTGSGASWSQQAVINSSTSPSTQAARVAISSDGATAVVIFDKIYIFTRSGSTWTQGQSITYNDTQQNSISFGTPLQISTDASTIVVGASQDGFKASTWNGAFYIFRNIDSNWIEVGKLYATVAQQNKDGFPSAIGLNSNGNTIVAGAKNDIWPSAGFDNGSAFAFAK